MRYAFANATVIDGTLEAQPQEGRCVLVADGRIESVDAGTAPSGYRVVDLGGRFLLPGLINMHVHLAGNGSPKSGGKDPKKTVDAIFATPVGAAVAHLMVAGFAKAALMGGVTTVRTVGGLRDLDTRVRDEIAAGRRIGPRILAANEAVSVPGGHMAGSVAVAATTVEEALAAVDAACDQNADLVKLMITGGVMDARAKGEPGEMKMPPEMVRACCDRAHARGRIVAAHVESPEGVRAALEGGVDSIEHGARPDEDTMALFAERGSFLVTTLSPALPYALFDRSVSGASEMAQFNGKVVFDGIRECSKAALAAGVPVALGNDVGCPWIAQYDFWRELVYFHKYVGASNALALHTATLGNARLAGIDRVTGSVEEGKDADLVVCARNPLEDLKALREVDMVMARGILVRHPHVRRNALLDRELDKFLD
ncbi:MULTISPECIES: amidohydrolase family protein [Olsenella]|uniref:amidohydrolase family protein n=1 Tax=Olsenella TaxID=133925 RepID=UPI0007844DD4|nr:MULTISPECIES: amidohydrolase family protein [Olsenella]KXB62308.1 amidohydrolase family protein [Olsenella sp. DNF00959]